MQKISCPLLLPRTRLNSALQLIALPILAISLASLNGCVLEPAKIGRTPPPDSTIIMPPAVPTMADVLQVFLLQAKKMTPPELAVEKEKTRAEFNADKSELNRMKLALLLALPVAANTPLATLAADDAELAGLVEPVASGGNGANSTNNADARAHDAELRVLALVIQGNVQERKRLRDQAREAQSRTQVAKTDSTKIELEARNLRTKVEELETQLAALKSIERNVNSRTKGRLDTAPKDGAPK